MADTKISALTSSTTPLAGTEVLPIVQSGATVKVAVSDLTAGRAVGTAALNATGIVSTTDTTEASSTTVGSLKTAGGLAVAKNLYAGGNTIVFGGNSIVPTIQIRGDATNEKHIDWYENGTLKLETYYASSPGAYVIRARTPSLVSLMTMNPTTPEVRSNQPFVAGSTCAVQSSTDSSSTITGALLVSGGVGVVKKIYAGDNLVIETAGKGISLPGGITWTSGAGSPEGVVTAPIGSLYSRSDGGVLTSLYVKQSGSGNTGWAGK